MQASVITPTFNAIAHIEACVRNVAAQGDAVLEHIVVDGGSSDGTVEAVARLMRTHPRLRFIPGPDRGQSDAMNKGTAAAAGEVIGILNVDDFYEPGAVADGVAVLAPIREPALAVGICRIMDAYHGHDVWNRPERMTPEYLLQNTHLHPLPANPSAYFYHRAVHDIVGGYDLADAYAMDADFLLTCAERVRCVYVPRHWGNFRLIPGCKTFENIEQGPGLVAALIARHRRGLGPRHRALLGARVLEGRARKVAWRALHRVGLR